MYKFCECCLVTELGWPKMPPIISPFLLCWKLRISKCLTMTSLAPCFTDPLTSSTPINAVVNEQVQAQQLFKTFDRSQVYISFYLWTTTYSYCGKSKKKPLMSISGHVTVVWRRYDNTPFVVLFPYHYSGRLDRHRRHRRPSPIKKRLRFVNRLRRTLIYAATPRQRLVSEALRSFTQAFI